MTSAAQLWESLDSEAALLRERGAAEPNSDRLRCATETVARMRPKLASFGITRLAEVTGLDRIGIPVWMAVRPNSKTLAVSQGKGLSDPAAQASAIMEATELAIAERCRLPLRLCSAADLAADGETAVTLATLLARGAEPLAETETVPWIEGYDLMARKSVWVPSDAVVLNAPGDVKEGGRRFWQSSDGLASGNILLEAVVHGLCERVERDALALWRFRSDAGVAEDCVDPASLEDAAVDGLAALIERSGLELRLFDMTSDVGVPAYFATISPSWDVPAEHWKHFDLSSGSGCHPSPARAAIRAITEAAQSRATSIAGARDDFDPHLYATQIKADLFTYVRAKPVGKARRDIGGDTGPADNLAFILERLDNVGIRSVIAVPLEDGSEGFAVAKVLVPELEHPPGDRRQRFGRRALKRMMGGAS